MSPQVNGTEARVFGTQVQPRTPILTLPLLHICLLTTIQLSIQEIRYIVANLSRRNYADHRDGLNHGTHT